MATLKRVESVVGPCPQFDIIEPWSPESGEPWELQVCLPELNADTASAVLNAANAAQDAASPVKNAAGASAAARRDIEDQATIGAGETAAVGRALDQGLLVPECFAVEGLAATRITAHDGTPWSADLATGKADATLQALSDRWVAAIHARLPQVAIESDRGPDTVDPVVHRTTGRLGARVHLAQMEHPDPEAFRRALLEATATLATGVPTIAHDALLDERWGTTLVVWLVAPHAEPLPGSAAMTAHRLTTPFAVQGLAASLELIVACGGEHHVQVAMDVTELAQRHGWGQGSLPRWMPTSDGWTFCACWSSTEGPPDALLDELVRVPNLDSAWVAPGEPVGLADQTPLATSHLVPSRHRWWQRLRDAVTDRDWLEVLTEPASGLPALETAPGLPSIYAMFGEKAPVRVVADSAGRPGLEMHLPPTSSQGAHRLLAALGEIDDPDLAGVGTWGFRNGQLLVRLWKSGVYDEPRRWTTR